MFFLDHTQCYMLAITCHVGLTWAHDLWAFACIQVPVGLCLHPST